MVNPTVFDKLRESYCNCGREVLLYNYTKEKEKSKVQKMVTQDNIRGQVPKRKTKRIYKRRIVEIPKIKDKNTKKLL